VAIIPALWVFWASRLEPRWSWPELRNFGRVGGAEKGDLCQSGD